MYLAVEAIMNGIWSYLGTLIFLVGKGAFSHG
jgi:hypothetical protein